MTYRNKKNNENAFITQTYNHCGPMIILKKVINIRHIIYKGDSLARIHELEKNSIHLTITSPPYFNAKDYHSEEENVGNNTDYEHYLDRIEGFLKGLYEATVPGGYVIWNTSPVLQDGQRFNIPIDSNPLFTSAGFEFKEDIIWVKPDGAAKLRCGGWVQNDGKPLTWHPNIATEYIMVYKKPGKREVDGKKFTPFKQHYSTRPKDILTNVWYINPETHTTWHDAPFPDELVKRCIVLYSYDGDTILDPFLGSGTTMKVARLLGRNSVGMELSDEYIELAKEKLGFYQKSLFGDETYEER